MQSSLCPITPILKFCCTTGNFSIVVLLLLRHMQLFSHWLHVGKVPADKSKLIVGGENPSGCKVALLQGWESPLSYQCLVHAYHVKAHLKDLKLLLSGENPVSPKCQFHISIYLILDVGLFRMMAI